MRMGISASTGIALSIIYVISLSAIFCIRTDPRVLEFLNNIHQKMVPRAAGAVPVAR